MKPEPFFQEPLSCTQCETIGEISFPNFQRNQLNVPCRIGIKGLPPGISESGFKNLFLTIGKPKFIQYLPERNSGIIEFGSWNEAELAVRDLHNAPPYYLKVYMITPNTGESSKSTDKKPCSAIKKDLKELQVSQNEEENFFKIDETETYLEENTDSKKETENYLQPILNSLTYDPSIRMRQKKVDFTSGRDCVSLGRGYFFTEMIDRFVGGLQSFSHSLGKLNDEANYNCKNCNALTTRICGKCLESFCSISCLNNTVLNHKNSCQSNNEKNIFHGSKTESEGQNLDSSEEEENCKNSDLSSSEEYDLNFEDGYPESGSKVIITMYCTLQTVFVRKIDGCLDENFIKLSNAVAVAALSEDKLLDPQIGDLCLARYSKDLCYYRAKISSLENDEATVIFIDYGNTEVVKIDDIKAIPEDLKKFPELAVKVELKNIPKGSSLKAVNYFNKLTAERIPLIMTYDEISEGVILTENDSDEIVNEKAVEYALPSWKIDESVISKLGEPFFMGSLKLQSLEVGKDYNLSISHFCEKEFIESRVFWATYVEADDFFHVKTEMKERMFEYCEYLKDDYYLPRVNELCLAKERGEWHRCVNLMSHRTSCFLYFLDDGHSSIIKTSNIRKIIKDFIEAPAQAICCILTGDPELKKDEKLQSEVVKCLNASVNQIVESIHIDEYLGALYCVTLPKIAEILK